MPDQERLHRLVGDRGGGGGLPLPPLFQVIVERAVDDGAVSVAELPARLKATTPKDERVRTLYGAAGYRGLAEDLCAQLVEVGVLTATEGGAFEPGPRLVLGRRLTVVPARRGKSSAQAIVVHDAKTRAVRATEDTAELRSMYRQLRSGGQFEVTVVGEKQPRQVSAHWIARLVPRMTEAEFLELAADIRVHGVRMPVLLLDGRILDGRHRAAAAAALRVPVPVHEFFGTEGQARDTVGSLNLFRRSLTTPQKALLVQELYLPQAEAEAAERATEGRGQGRARQERGPDGRVTGSASIGAEPVTSEEVAQSQPESDPEPVDSGKARQRAAEMSGGAVSRSSLERMEPVRNAPRTQERIRSGEIKTVAEARRAAEEETGKAAPKPAPASHNRTAWSALGEALHAHRRCTTQLESGEAIGGASTQDWLDRLDEIQGLVDRDRKVVEGW